MCFSIQTCDKRNVSLEQLTYYHRHHSSGDLIQYRRNDVFPKVAPCTSKSIQSFMQRKKKKKFLATPVNEMYPTKHLMNFWQIQVKFKWVEQYSKILFNTFFHFGTWIPYIQIKHELFVVPNMINLLTSIIFLRKCYNFRLFFWMIWKYK